MSLGPRRPPQSAAARRRPRGVLARGGFFDQMSGAGLPLATDNSDFTYKALLARLSGTGSYGLAMEELLASTDFEASRSLLVQASLAWCYQRLVVARLAATLAATVPPGEDPVPATGGTVTGEAPDEQARGAASLWREGGRLAAARGEHVAPFEPLYGGALAALWEDALRHSAARLAAIPGQRSLNGTAGDDSFVDGTDPSERRKADA